ncbi:MAG: phosphotransferase [Cyanobacteria bacterium SZAS LIN-5]|nr:phosphotransferase [Cyanobacteria bacterium SZAS LIN-5]
MKKPTSVTRLTQQEEDQSLTLLTPAPEDKLDAWLSEFYGKPVQISSRQLLRHRDLSYVERLNIDDALPSSLIYKQVLPPWDVEQDLHEKILIPSISNSAQLYLTATHGPLTALFMEDLGTGFLETLATSDLAGRVGEELAKLHRAYSYRTAELIHTNVLRTLLPSDYERLTGDMVRLLNEWRIANQADQQFLEQLAALLASKLAGETTSLVHGDLYAENIIVRNERLFIIDWSWFTVLGVPLMDLATLAMNHHKNGKFANYREQLIDSYCYESGRNADQVRSLLPYAETLSRLLFLQWLVERRRRGILGTTVGPVDNLIPKLVQELRERRSLIPA